MDREYIINKMKEQHELIEQLTVKFEDNKCKKTATVLSDARIELRNLQTKFNNHRDTRREDEIQMTNQLNKLRKIAMDAYL